LAVGLVRRAPWPAQTQARDAARWRQDGAEAMTNTIGWAVKELHNGNRVARSGWNGKGMWLALQMPGESTGIKMTLPYVYMKTVDGDLVPWVCSQTDLLAVDWELAT
jgi:hypothetical protein